MEQDLKKLHRKIAVDLFNKVWDLMEKKDRTTEEELDMLHSAHASRYHWGIVGNELNFARGEWQISRVYAILNSPERALYHAQKSMDYCKENDIGDFDLAFAYESLARAYSLTDQITQFQSYLEKAVQASESIEKDGDRKVFLQEIEDLREKLTT